MLRKDQLYIANAGPTHTILLNENQIEDFHDPADAGRGLGISRTAKLKYHRTQIQPNDLILLCANPAEKWSEETFHNSTNISLDNLRRRLISQAGTDLEAAVMQFKPGEGNLHFLKPRAPVTTQKVIQEPEAGDEVRVSCDRASTSDRYTDPQEVPLESSETPPDSPTTASAAEPTARETIEALAETGIKDAPQQPEEASVHARKKTSDGYTPAASRGNLYTTTR